MQNTLPNEPLQIVITEAGSENLLFRALLKKVVVVMVCGDQATRNELAGVIAYALDDVTPETCPDCGELRADCVCSLYPSRQQLDAMQAKTCEEWEAQFGRNITDAEAQEAEEVRNFFDKRFEN